MDYTTGQLQETMTNLDGITKNPQIYWYELCFYGDEDCDSENYQSDKACSYVIKTEIPPCMDKNAALMILFGSNPDEYEKELINNCTCVIQVDEDEAQFFDIDGLVVRKESEFGIYYARE